MIGRGCIRNPWLFDQIRAHLTGQPVLWPRGREVLAYVGALYESTQPTATFKERLQVEKMKKYMNFVGEGFAPEFLFRLRRSETRAEFFAICRDFLDHDEPLALAGKQHDPLPDELPLAA
jgi:tRNA-dihydrouridine synthase C